MAHHLSYSRGRTIPHRQQGGDHLWSICPPRPLAVHSEGRHRANQQPALCPIIQASVGFHNTRGLKFGAFGGLVPSKEKKDVLGILFPSACFVGRSPEEGAMFSFFIGGVRHADMLDWSDEKLKNMILKNIHSMLKFPADAQPDLIKIHRHQKAIPQYEKSSEARFKMIEELQTRYPGLILAGNIKGGIGMADRIRQATGIASELSK